MADDEGPIYEEPPYLEGLNDLGEVLEGVQVALGRPERFSSETLSALAGEIAAAARRYGVYEPFD
jgi:hypothetical protein